MLRKFLPLIIFTFLLWITLANAAVDLNRASLSELEALPGVGSSIAKEIVAARPFKYVSDLKKVKGIGSARYSVIAPMVTVEKEKKVKKDKKARASRRSLWKTETQQAPLQADEMIDINSASREDLERLPGVGPARAQAIINARPYKSPEDVLRAKGVGEKTYAKIRDHIVTE